MSGIRGFDGSLFGDFEREVVRARRSAARKIGRQIVSERRRRLGNKVSPLRKRAVRSYAARDGTLIVVDHAPMAVSQEFGATIRARKSKYLRIDAGEEASPDDNVFTIPGKGENAGFVIASSGRKGDNRLLAVLRKSIRVKQLEQSRRLTFIAERRFDRYIEEITKNLEL